MFKFTLHWETTAQLMVFLLQKPLENSYSSKRSLIDVTPSPGKEVSLKDCWEHSPEVQPALSGQVKYTHNSCRTCRISHKSHIASKSYIISDNFFLCVSGQSKVTVKPFLFGGKPSGGNMKFHFNSPSESEEVGKGEELGSLVRGKEGNKILQKEKGNSCSSSERKLLKIP